MYQRPSHCVKTPVTRPSGEPGLGSRSSWASTVTWAARTPAPASMHSRETTKAAMPMTTAWFHVRPSVRITGDGAVVVMSSTAPPCPLPFPVVVSPLPAVGSSEVSPTAVVVAASAAGDRAPDGVPEGCTLRESDAACGN